MFTPLVLRFDSLSSTNTEAARQASEGAAEGLCVISAEQTAGRGRLERSWVSPRGAGLYFSVVLRPQFEQSVWPLLTLMAAVAVHDTLAEVFALDADIKWPNDVLVNEKKLCGILAETVETRLGRAVVVGIGINLKGNSFPPELADSATSVEDVTGLPANADQVIEPLVRSLNNHYKTLHLPEGPERIVREWTKRSSYAIGKRMRIANGESIIEGVSRGVQSDGSLILETDAGETRVIRTGDVTRLRASAQKGNEDHA